MIAETLHNIFKLYPEYTIAQHLSGILRRKSPEAEQSYFWTNDQLLNHLIEYKVEILQIKQEQQN